MARCLFWRLCSSDIMKAGPKLFWAKSSDWLGNYVSQRAVSTSYQLLQKKSLAIHDASPSVSFSHCKSSFHSVPIVSSISSTRTFLNSPA